MANVDFEQICSQVREIAAKAAEFIEKESENVSWNDVEFKGRNNITVSVDEKAEKMIVERLKEILPDAVFVAEEETDAKGGAEKARKTIKKEEYTWIVDPLDGTTNYMRQLPPYCVSIALANKGEVVVGVIYEITRKECFYAWKGSCAYMNGKKISVSNIDKLDDSLIATGFSYDSLDRMAEFSLQQDYFLKYTHGGRRIGSAAANLAYLACGRFDGYSQFNLAPWDVAAGSLIVKAAGGIVTDYRGGNDYLTGGEIVACNAKIYDRYLEAISATLESDEVYPVG